MSPLLIDTDVRSLLVDIIVGKASVGVVVVMVSSNTRPREAIRSWCTIVMVVAKKLME